VKVLVLAGGDSNEREVSLNSGAAICRALIRLGHEVRALDPGTGQPLIDSSGRLLLEGGQAPYDTPAIVAPEPAALVTAISNQYGDADVVFLALHGGRGENGSIQNLLELAGKKYTGSNMTASAVAMDKALSKRVMASIGVPTPEWGLYRLTGEFDPDAIAADVKERFEMPLILKPNDGGSTIGLVKVTEAVKLPDAVRQCAEHTREILVERYVAGRELTVSVFDGRAYPVVEIKAKSGLYDYEAKYTKGKSEYFAPADIPPEMSSNLQDAAVRLVDAIGCTGLVRVDFMADHQGRFFCLELARSDGGEMRGDRFRSSGFDDAGVRAEAVTVDHEETEAPRPHIRPRFNTYRIRIDPVGRTEQRVP
jgi:D-alanine-D-alanine ligase